MIMNATDYFLSSTFLSHWNHEKTAAVKAKTVMSSTVSNERFQIKPMPILEITTKTKKSSQSPHTGMALSLARTAVIQLDLSFCPDIVPSLTLLMAREFYVGLRLQQSARLLRFRHQTGRLQPNRGTGRSASRCEIQSYHCVGLLPPIETLQRLFSRDFHDERIYHSSRGAGCPAGVYIEEGLVCYTRKPSTASLPAGDVVGGADEVEIKRPAE